MAKRYKKSSKFQNNNPMYSEKLSKRKIKSIEQYPTLKLGYPDGLEASNLIIHTHIWKMGDSYTKLANKFYGDPKLWWVVAHFNQIPIEGDIHYGQQVYIAEPLEALLNSFGV
tara:strand:- start:2223 stop:2561 length:339 start_codon:yes stop_codon:yes gene_type:complete